ncbi:MAG: hypothetical protein P4M00_07900 [Azospirillaceae bacterium]|nr:hypothetical protein [Azospirillaceae bacterium]
MFLIGVGTGLPWGLMDGLSVSVVPKERAGMATGIFGTTRVAGEGVALAIVNAVLAGLAKNRLTVFAPQGGLDVGPVAQKLAMGDVHGAAALLPNLALYEIQESYSAAFQHLCDVLIAITLVAAFIIFALLRSDGATGRRSGIMA